MQAYYFRLYKLIIFVQINKYKNNVLKLYYFYVISVSTTE